MTPEQYRELRETSPRCEKCGEFPAMVEIHLRPVGAENDANETKESMDVCRSCAVALTCQPSDSRLSVWVITRPAANEYAVHEWGKQRLINGIEQAAADMDCFTLIAALTKTQFIDPDIAAGLDRDGIRELTGSNITRR